MSTPMLATDAGAPPFAAFADAAIGVALDEAPAEALDDARTTLALDSASVFHTLCVNAGAEGPERELLALLVACELDPVRAARIGVLVGATRPSRITLGAAARLLGGTLACAEAAGPGSALRRAALVGGHRPGLWATTEVELAPQVLWALLGDPSPDADLPVGTRHVDRPASTPRSAEVVLVSGPDRVRRRDLAIERSGGGRFLVAPAPASDAGWAAIVREATLTGRAVVVELDDGLPEEGRRWVERATHLGWALTCVDELPVRDLPDRARSEHVASADLVTDDEWRAAVGPDVPLEHRLTAEQTELVAAVHPTVDGDVHVAVRRLLAGPLGTLARRVRPQKSWDDLVLSGAKLAQLRSIVARYQHAGRVLDDWGLSHAAGRGIVSLFTGQSGTGKTLAAEVVASELGLDMYRIDISTVVSKYIGETEQNLERLFAAASAGSSVLFFDEADSLFGKRAEVKDGRDRYANLEVSYLLQRLETYDGIVVLATNLPKNIDDAFLRRIHFVVDFPTPAGPERRAIWERHLRDGVPQGDLDLDLLARRYELTGGVIRNAVVAAAFQAADEDRPVEMRHVRAALIAEYVKLGRVVREEDFDGLQ
ncbi:ATP-binding protein [Nocardioides soli]|uniref:AAA+ superfamily predicted ATPase n=1 Tax=Nocardioides soli TaxID=1036020 RepID=A0A7W4Z094_9ACTN|nr:ATP-binding protein [Nocardioides soli]MBB3041628.1 AAA+ superfamily predicted ATPase [Nocardioides soli]